MSNPWERQEVMATGQNSQVSSTATLGSLYLCHKQPTPLSISSKLIIQNDVAKNNSYIILLARNCVLLLESLTRGSRDAAFSVAGLEPAWKAKRRARLHRHPMDTIRSACPFGLPVVRAGFGQTHVFLLLAEVQWWTEDQKAWVAQKISSSSRHLNRTLQMGRACSREPDSTEIGFQGTQ